MADLAGADSSRFRYARSDCGVRLASGGFVLVLVLGGLWVLLRNRPHPVAVAILVALLVAASAMCWVMLRGGVDRTATILCRPDGLVFAGPGGRERALAWPAVRELRHVWRSADPHLAIRVRGARRTHRIYYEIERAEELVATIARRSERIANGYTLPLELVRPALPRAMVLPILTVAPALVLATLPVMKGVWMPGLILGGFGAFIILGSYRLHRRQPLAIQISEPGGIVQRAADDIRSLRLDQVTEVRLELVKRVPRRPVLVVQGRNGGRLEFDLAWVDPVRLYALILGRLPAADGHALDR